jgi:hypothetical protein
MTGTQKTHNMHGSMLSFTKSGRRREEPAYTRIIYRGKVRGGGASPRFHRIWHPGTVSILNCFAIYYSIEVFGFMCAWLQHTYIAE